MDEIKNDKPLAIDDNISNHSFKVCDAASDGSKMVPNDEQSEFSFNGGLKTSDK